MALRLLFRELLEVTEMKLDHLLLDYNLIPILKITTGVRVSLCFDEKYNHGPIQAGLNFHTDLESFAFPSCAGTLL